MAYSADLDALSPDHRWAFDGNSGTDSVGGATVTLTGTLAATDICEDVSNSMATNTISNDSGVVTSGDIDSNAATRKAVCGWFAVSEVSPHPCRIYGEGDATPTFQFVMAMGNSTMLEIVDGATVKQLYGIGLVVDRPYHLMGILEGTAHGDYFKFYIDGVEQGTDTFDSASLAARTQSATFGDPSYTVGVGGDTVLLQAATVGSYNQWVSWGEKTLPTSTEIRVELFEKGATPEVTITNQAGLDALADTVRGNTPLAILVNVAGSISLTADNVTFNPLCSIHIQYNGTGTLTWTNTNGSDTSIYSTTGGGTVIIQESVSIKVTNQKASDFTPVEGSRIRLVAANGGGLAEGTVIVEGLTDVNGEVSGTFLYTSAQPYTIKCRRSTTSPYYKEAKGSGVIVATGLDTTLLMVRDE